MSGTSEKKSPIDWKLGTLFFWGEGYMDEFTLCKAGGDLGFFLKLRT